MVVRNGQNKVFRCVLEEDNMVKPVKTLKTIMLEILASVLYFAFIILRPFIWLGLTIALMGVCYWLVLLWAESVQ